MHLSSATRAHGLEALAAVIDAGGRTEMHDIVEYEVAGPSFIERKFVRPQLQRIFEYRQQVLAWNFRQVGAASLVITDAEATLGTNPAERASVRVG